MSLKIFTCGPVAMFPEALSVRCGDIAYFRTQEYAALVKYCLKKLSLYLGNDLEDSLLYLACSGTGAMETAVENVTGEEDRALVINGGSFGQRFCELLKYHNIEYKSIDLQWNERLEKKHFSKFEKEKFTMMFVNLDETSTGQLYDINLISSYCKEHGMLLIADIISSFLCDQIDMKRDGIDLAIFSSQKGLCCSPGCSFISVNERMKAKILNSKNKTASLYFNLKDYFINMDRGQTPYTPTVMVIYEVYAMIQLIEKFGGVHKWMKTIEDKARFFREKAIEIGYSIPEYRLSNMLTPLYLKGIPSDLVANELRSYGFYVSPCGGDLAEKIFRVCHLGSNSVTDTELLLEALGKVKEKLIKND